MHLDTREQDIVCTSIASIVNKLPIGSLLDSLLDLFDKERVADPICQQRLLAWVAKAAMQRGLPNADALFDAILEAIEAGGSRGGAAAGQCKILFVDNLHLPVRKPLYKQKYFTKALARVVPGFSNRQISNEQRAVFLSALGGLLKGLPQGALLNSAATIMPLLLQALDLPDTSALQETLSTFQLLIQIDSSIVEQHLGSLIPSLLKIACSEGFQASPTARAAALECLLAFSKFPYHKVHPFKSSIVNDLRKALDDNKRFVRKAAVLCRNEWIVLSSAPAKK